MKRSPLAVLFALMAGSAFAGQSATVHWPAAMGKSIIFVEPRPLPSRLLDLKLLRTRSDHPEPPPWLRPNQRQRRLARRRRHAAGDPTAFL